VAISVRGVVFPVDTQVCRVRFAPSPTGYLHIGGARTALFNWLLARKMGGVFVLRIEDTDRSRHVADSLAKILADMRWLGLDWDEGPEAGAAGGTGGSFGPYAQSERLAIYQEHVARLIEAGHAYHALETPEELTAMRDAARQQKIDFRYPRPDPLPTTAEVQAARDAGRSAVVRFKMPGEDITVVDDILGEVTLAADQLEDFVIQKGDGWPTYHLACVADDALMEITHVLRGQEHLMNTPKHIALQRALGFDTPHYAHLPIIFNMNGSKMSKRDKEKALKRGEVPPEIDVHDFRAAGYLPEALLNFISLLGWSTGDDEEQITLQETADRFALKAIGKGNAKFDRDKLISFNTDWSARVEPVRLLAGFVDYLRVNDLPMASLAEPMLQRVLQLCQGFRTFADVVAKVGFAFADDADIVYQEKAVRKVLEKNDGAGYGVLRALLPRLESIESWTADAIESELKAFCDAGGLKLGNVAQPLRVALSGGTVSPAIYDTLDLVGRERTLSRIKQTMMQGSEQ